MTGSWRELSKIIGILLALSLIAYNLYVGVDIVLALFRGVAAFLAFTIVNTVFTTIIYKTVNEFEYKRLEDLNQLEDALSMDDEEEDEDFSNRAMAEGHAE